jgi:hypothetical protein
MVSRSIESRLSWVIAIVALAALTVSYGAPLVTVVAMKPIAAEFGAGRSAPASQRMLCKRLSRCLLTAKGYGRMVTTNPLAQSVFRPAAMWR